MSPAAAHRSTRPQRAVLRSVVIGAVALLPAACGSSTGSPSATASSPQGAAVRYASCMRTHGIANYPDPQVTTTPGGGGSVAIAGPSGPGAAPAFHAAQNACNGLLAPIINATEHHGPSRQAFLAFARCLRSHGLSDFPDPDAQGHITGQMIHATGVDLQAPAFLTDAKTCVGVTHGAITIADVERAAEQKGQ